ncbi:MAG TPA: hypothetical protein PK246_02140 [Saprospiraceae bacterium]|nr:hypothetical protein [Lewinellaceae bacterium]HPK09109.1 hypothetical protein [Saprospiraceae bacterium]
MVKTKFIIVGILIVTSFLSCKHSPKMALIHEANSFASVLDSTAASIQIIDDIGDDFFENISALDMSIQMKNDEFLTDRNQCLVEYKKYLQTQTRSFTQKEKAYIESVLPMVETLISNINPELLIKSNIAKISTNHYGNDVYYTRNNTIFIPENVLIKRDSNNLRNVLIHEMFHIISRNQPILKEKLYGLIGFKKCKNEAILPQILQEILLSNPDGPNMDYYITLKSPDTKTEVNAMPLITTNTPNYESDKSGIFSYLTFDLFAYEVTTDSLYSTKTGKTTIDPSYMQSFFNQIKDNTQYIIHPDEIMADNFLIACQMTEDSEMKLSQEGKQLLDKVIFTLSQFK